MNRTSGWLLLWALSGCATGAPGSSLRHAIAASGAASHIVAVAATPSPSAPEAPATPPTPAPTVVVAGPLPSPSPVVAQAGGWLQASPVQTQLLAGSDGSTWLGLWVDAPQAATGVRAPMDVSLVVDTSGSMSGAKIASARMAAGSFLETLRDGDIASVFTFSDVCRQLSGPTVLGRDSRPFLMQRLQGMVAVGGTNMYAGLQAGEGAMAQAPATHPIRRVVVISDGQANIGPSSPAELGDLAARGTESGAQVTAIGVGLDYDERTLAALAVRSAGSLYHLEEPSQMAAILQSEMNLLGHTVASNAWVEFEPSPGVVVEATPGLRTETVDGKVRVALGTLHGGQHREVLLRARVPTGAVGARTLGTARLVFDDPGTHGRSVREVPLTVNVTGDRSAAQGSGNQRVQAMVVSYEATQAQFRATEALRQGDATRAQAELASAEQTIQRAQQEYHFTDEVVQGSLARQSSSIAAGRVATEEAARSPNRPAAMRRATLINNNSAYDALGL
ncbi:MAG: VWA domain-containing protein [Deltaproteobacteria bacterium]|nr:VWA domain-containing protein [Deltaproteobacteria bacterium]